MLFMDAFRFAKCAGINVKEKHLIFLNQYLKVSSSRVFRLPDDCLLEKENMTGIVQKKMGGIKGRICVLLENLMSAWNREILLMADKDLHWIRGWDIISAAAVDGLFSHYLRSTGTQLLGIKITVGLYSIEVTSESTTLTQIRTFTWYGQIRFKTIKI